MEFEPIIGLEIHTQLATQTKIFCRCSVDFGKQPNKNTCPVCLGLPGALPTINQKAVEFAIQLGLATNSTIRMDSQFARKNYFYPDLPKAYQTSQFDRPICEHGWVEIEVEGKTKKIGITRIHMEEDAGKLVHDGEDPNASYIDLNRAGTPLLEIVSEPEITSSKEAKAYMEKLHSIVTYLGISHGNMEKGHLRCDANVSLRLVGETEFGTRTETKNLNSFKNIQVAIDYEIDRQTDVLLEGGEIVQETRLWNADTKKTRSMRGKEDSADYRYFPCPDLPIVQLSEEWIQTCKNNLPELPDQKKNRFIKEYQLSSFDASLLVTDKNMATYFETVVQQKVPPKIVANWLMGDVSKLLNEHNITIQQCKVTSNQLAHLLQLIQDNVISGKIAKTVFQEMFQTGNDADLIIETKGLKQVSDSKELSQICETILKENPTQVEQYQQGKQKVFGFFVGQVMKATQGKANPQVINEMLKKMLS